jgi:hypothetical protein
MCLMGAFRQLARHAGDCRSTPQPFNAMSGQIDHTASLSLDRLLLQL